jgi:hypothetical protein
MSGYVRVEEFEKLTKKQLRQKANDCFAAADGAGELVRTALLTEARFYLEELARRVDSRVSIRDLILELVVIILIGAELRLGFEEGKQQQAAFGKIQGTLAALQASSEATAKTLTALQSTTEGMNAAIQQELSLFYDVSVTTTYSPADKRLVILNMGRTNVTVSGVKIADVVALTIPEGSVVSPQSTFNCELATAPAYAFILQESLKNKDGMTPFDIFVKNERHEDFRIHSYFIVKDNAIANVQEGYIAPQRGSKTKH